MGAPGMTRKPFRNGRVHVCSQMCPTCIFRPGNLMNLDPGRRDQMVKQAMRQESAITCHETLDGLQSVCRGFFERHATAPLQIAARLNLITFTKAGQIAMWERGE